MHFVKAVDSNNATELFEPGVGVAQPLFDDPCHSTACCTLSAIVPHKVTVSTKCLTAFVPSRLRHFIFNVPPGSHVNVIVGVVVVDARGNICDAHALSPHFPVYVAFRCRAAVWKLYNNPLADPPAELLLLGMGAMLWECRRRHWVQVRGPPPTVKVHGFGIEVNLIWYQDLATGVPSPADVQGSSQTSHVPDHSIRFERGSKECLRNVLGRNTKCLAPMHQAESGYSAGARIKLLNARGLPKCITNPNQSKGRHT